MYSRDEDHAIRKKNYVRYRKLSEKGYSISEETSQTALYYINEDPFGRTYYQKSLGEVAVQDPLTGRTYTQEEWATKEFVVDNKAQLINKVSADLVAGKRTSVQFAAASNPPEELIEWLKDFLEKNRFTSKVSEWAMRVSALGDQYIELSVENSGVKCTEIDPELVYIEHDHGNIVGYEIAWEIEIEAGEGRRLFKTKRQLKTYVQKKFHYPGLIRWELYEEKGEEFIPVPLITNPSNRDLLERASTSPHMRMLLVDEKAETGKEVETEDIQYAFIVEEKTGVDEPLLVHWPNYRMFDIYGVSDNGVIENLQNALNNRETQLNDVLDKHADPAMYGDASFLDINGNLTMSGGGGRYFPVQAGENPPGYLEWGGHLTDSQEEIKRIYKAILDNTETAPALLGDDTGGVQSGRALMYKLIRSLAMATRKTRYFREAVQTLVRRAYKLKVVWIDGDGVTSFEEETSTEWDLYPVIVETQSAIPTDVDEIIKQVVQLVREKLISRESGLQIIEKFFDEIDVETEKKLLQQEFDQQMQMIYASMPDLMAGVPEEQ